MSSRSGFKFKVGGIILAILLVIGLILLKMSTTTIKPGFAGVVYNMNGGVQEKCLGQGWHVIGITQNVTSYPVSTETVFLSKDGKEGSKEDESFDINSKSGKAVNVDVSYAYHMDANKLADIFTKFRGQDTATIENNFIRTQLKSSINTVSSQYEVMDIYGGSRPEIQQKVFDSFSKDMQQYGITIENFSFLAIRPDQASMKAIQDKVDAEQALQTAKVAQDRAKVDAETKRVTAQGDADSALIKAQGEAKANAALQQSLTPELVQYTIAQKWNGILPQVSGGNSIISMPGLTSSTSATTTTATK